MKPGNDKFIFDLHCDTITECYKQGVDLADEVLHLSLDKLPPGYRLCQCMAVFIPDGMRGDAATHYFQKVADRFRQQLEQYRGRVVQVMDTTKVNDILQHTEFAMILTVESGAVLEGNLERLYELHIQGVKMITLTWNSANEICGGVATEEGFTPFGREVVARMEALRMVVDVSHLSDTGFWELCDFATRPFVASHSNARSVCDHRRNLTDAMFCELRDRGGLVGLNYYDSFIRRDGGSVEISDLLRHVHHFLALGGENTLALGSDFDGADMPPYLNGLDKTPDLRQAMLDSGIDAGTVEKLFYENARRFFATL